MDYYHFSSLLLLTSSAVSRKISDVVTETSLKAPLLAWLVHILVEFTNARLYRLKSKLGWRNTSVVTTLCTFYLLVHQSVVNYGKGLARGFVG